MKLRDDLTRWEHVSFESTPWTASPEPQVQRKMLERDGEEVARASSIVRYAAQSSFPEHVHERGEEFIVLEGTFSDEHGDYPEGSYVRNPPGSKHRPFSRPGCTIFVKLRQFDPNDSRRCWLPLALDGTEQTTPLHEFGSERVSIVRLGRGESLALNGSSRGLELFVLRGSLELGGERCGPWSWLRAPQASGKIESASGCVFWLKLGHLP